MGNTKDDVIFKEFWRSNNGLQTCLMWWYLEAKR